MTPFSVNKMKINGTPYHTIWVDPKDASVVKIIDQEKLPFEFKTAELRTADDAFLAIQNMKVRGAPLIGVTGAFGIYLSLISYHGSDWEKHLSETSYYLKSARPTAVNLAILIDELYAKVSLCSTKEEAVTLAFEEADRLKTREIEHCESIGNFGSSLIEQISNKKKGEVVNILTHCNAGWLACIDWGTATAPIYKAFEKGIPIHNLGG